MGGGDTWLTAEGEEKKRKKRGDVEGMRRRVEKEYSLFTYFYLL